MRSPLLAALASGLLCATAAAGPQLIIAHAHASSPASTGRNFDDPIMDHLHGLPAAELKRDYLNCVSDSDTGRLGISGIEACSMVYEELLQRVFGGDFDALLAWSRRQAADDAGHQLVADPPGQNERP